MSITDEKTDKVVVDMLWSKHPAERIPEILENFGDPLPLPILDISKELVEEVAKTISGWTATGGSKTSHLQLWLKTYIDSIEKS